MRVRRLKEKSGVNQRELGLGFGDGEGKGLSEEENGKGQIVCNRCMQKTSLKMRVHKNGPIWVRPDHNTS